MTPKLRIALTLYGEARGEPVEGKIAVACVLRNRVKDGRWGDSYESVCLAPKQFSCWNTNDPNRTLLDTLGVALESGGEPDGVMTECLWIADGLISGALRERVRKSTHYYAAWMKEAPAWARPPAVLEVQVGKHLFFSNVR